MTTLTLERSFSAEIDTVFAFISKTENLLKWWGPEGVHVPEHNLDFERTGPWFSVMKNDEGQVFKVSGQVTSVSPPTAIGFTWAWHDDDDQRGAESHVIMTLSAGENGGTKLVLQHNDLADDEIAARHNEGWTSSLSKLERLVK